MIKNGEYVKCKICEKETYVPRVKMIRDKNHFCSKDCYSEWQSINNIGINNNGYKGGGLVDCSNCGKKVYKNPSRVDRYKRCFCSRECYYNWMSKNLTGKNNYHYNQTIVTCDDCGKEMSRPQCRIIKNKRHFCNMKCFGSWMKKQIPFNKGKKFSLKHIENLRISHLGNIPTMETRQKMSKSMLEKNNSNWKNINTSLYERIRKSFKYRIWRDDVYTRDNFTCQDCGDDRGGNLNAHHIELFTDILKSQDINTYEQALSCEKLWNINNGITLCIKCHKIRHAKTKKIEVN